jgi:uncharacterized membrane protein
MYNAVQKMLYLGIMALGVLIVISGLALWKPVQFSELAALFGSFQTIRVVHFLCMAAIVGFLVVHISLALLVPHSLVAMVTGGPLVDDRPAVALKAPPKAAAPVAPAVPAVMETAPVGPPAAPAASSAAAADAAARERPDKMSR